MLRKMKETAEITFWFKYFKVELSLVSSNTVHLKMHKAKFPIAHEKYFGVCVFARHMKAQAHNKNITLI